MIRPDCVMALEWLLRQLCSSISLCSDWFSDAPDFTEFAGAYVTRCLNIQRYRTVKRTESTKYSDYGFNADACCVQALRPSNTFRLAGSQTNTFWFAIILNFNAFYCFRLFQMNLNCSLTFRTRSHEMCDHSELFSLGKFWVLKLF